VKNPSFTFKASSNMSFFDNPFKLFLQPPSQKLMFGFGGEVREFVGQLARLRKS
jgi:hypothetical protein